MKGIFIPEITVEMFRNGCLESIEALMAEGEVYDIEYDPKSAEPPTKCVAEIRIDKEDLENLVAEKVEEIKEAMSMNCSEFPTSWIPCSEGLPDTNGVYNVTRKISDGFECKNISDTCYYDGTNTWHDDTRVNHARGYITDVIAWMPLPEPYQSQEK